MTDASLQESRDIRAQERAKLREQAVQERSQRVPERKGAKPWDKQRTRELFERYQALRDKVAQQNQKDSALEDESLDELIDAARDELVKANMNLVRKIAAKYKEKGIDYDDLVQVGTEGLIKAIDRYDIERGAEFTTFATPTIQGEIRRHFRDKGWAVRVPRSMQELSSKVNAAKEELFKELQRDPSVQEIAEHLGVEIDEVLEAMESSSLYGFISIDEPSDDADDSTAAGALVDMIDNGDNSIDATIDRLTLDKAISTLSSREQEILDLRINKGLTQNEIADQLGVSQVQVSRLLRKCLARLRTQLEE